MEPQSGQPYRYLHQVFFRLADRTPETFDTFVRLCREHLSGHRGMEVFELGIRDVEQQRSVNEQQFDVSMTMIFDRVDSFNHYREHADHQKWVTLAGSMSVGRKVYDCYLLPEPAN